MGNMLIVAVLVSLLLGGLQTPHPHRTITITVTFDYDFRITPACSAKVTQRCVQQFNLYEVSLGISKRAKLLAIPVPAGATGFVKGISATTEPYLFDSGRHRLAVSAQMPDGQESDLSECTTIIKVP
jgi:hypothetical protein